MGKQKSSRRSSNDLSRWTKPLLVGHKALDQSSHGKRCSGFSFPSEFTPSYKFTVRFGPHLYLSATFPQAIFEAPIQMQYHVVTVTPPRHISNTFMFSAVPLRKSFREKVEASEFEVESGAWETMRSAERPTTSRRGKKTKTKTKKANKTHGRVVRAVRKTVINSKAFNNG